MIDQIVDIEVAEMIRFYGTLVGTPGMSDANNKLCNDNIAKLLAAIQPKVGKITAKVSGIITK